MNEFNSILSIIISIMAIIGGLYGLSEFIAKRRKAIAEFYTGSWGNEGDVTQKYHPSHYIEVSLKVDSDGEVSGLIKSCRNLSNDKEISLIDLSGSINLVYCGKLIAFKSSATKMPRYGSIQLKKLSKRLIELTLLEEENFIEGEQLLPQKVTLFRQ